MSVNRSKELRMNKIALCVLVSYVAFLTGMAAFAAMFGPAPGHFPFFVAGFIGIPAVLGYVVGRGPSD